MFYRVPFLLHLLDVDVEFGGNVGAGLLQHNQSKAHLWAQLHSWLRITAIFIPQFCLFAKNVIPLNRVSALNAHVCQPLPPSPTFQEISQTTCFAPVRTAWLFCWNNNLTKFLPTPLKITIKTEETNCIFGANRWHSWVLLMDSALKFVGLICLCEGGMTCLRQGRGAPLYNMQHTTLQNTPLQRTH